MLRSRSFATCNCKLTTKCGSVFGEFRLLLAEKQVSLNFKFFDRSFGEWNDFCRNSISHRDISLLRLKIVHFTTEAENSAWSIFQKFVFRTRLSKNIQVLFCREFMCWPKPVRCMKHVGYLGWAWCLLKVKMMTEKSERFLLSRTDF